MSRVDLLDLSICGLNPLSLAEALERPERARKVRLDKPSADILKLRRVYTLNLGALPPPKWLGKLVHLRRLIWSAPVKSLPASVLGLPRLRYVHLEDSKLESLDGIEQLAALDTITVGRTPAQDRPGALEAAAKAIGGKASSYSIEVRETPKPPPKARLAERLAADDVADRAVLPAAKLDGATFEDLYLTQDFRATSLAKTTWRRCDFEYANLAGVNLAGATFEDCYFSAMSGADGMFAKAKLAGARFVRCGGTLSLHGADLAGASFVEMESDVHYDLDKVKAKGLVLNASFCSEKEHQITASGADLRGATIAFDVTADRRAAIAKKPAKLAWKTDHLKGAKTDGSTVVTYAPLGGAAKPAPNGIDRKGPAAKSLGSIHAPNASLWVLAIDAADAAAWRGSVDEGDGKDDFQRALAVGDGKIKVGKATGVIAQISDRGWSEVWQVDGGVALVDATIQISKPKERDHEMALRVAQWPPKKPAKVGSITVKSGVLALLLPFRDGAFSPAELKSAKRAPVLDKELERVLVPVPNGTYDVLVHDFGPTPNYEDDVGVYTSVTRIVQS